MSLYFHTPPLKITDTPADSRHVGGIYRTPRFIVFHASKGRYSDKWLSTDPLSDVGCNRLIKSDGRNIKIAPDGVNSHTQGYGVMGPWGAPGTYVKVPLGKGQYHEYTCYQDINEAALSIEFENIDDGSEPYTDQQLTAGACQVIEWKSEYGDLPTLSHFDIDTRKDDPKFFPWQRYYTIYFSQLAAVLCK